MKILFPNGKDPSTGKGFFAQRLKKELKKQGIKIITNPKKKHDISLNFVKIKNKSKTKKIIRLDGVYFNKKQPWKKMNSKIAKNMNKADGIIYQSEYSKYMCKKYLGKFKGKTAIIPNGADPEYYKNIEKAESNYKYNFLAVSRWRPHKRLKDIIESFLLANIPESCLFIIGNLEKSGLNKIEIKKYKNIKNIKFLNVLNQKQLASYYKLCNASIHLCWFDSCPNSVIEALTAGCPVISNNTGGTPELVNKAGGIVCGIDKTFNYNPVKLYSPPKIDRKIIVNALYDIIDNPIKVNVDSFNINNIAKQYIKFFKEFI